MEVGFFCLQSRFFCRAFTASSHFGARHYLHNRYYPYVIFLTFWKNGAISDFHLQIQKHFQKIYIFKEAMTSNPLVSGDILVCLTLYYCF